MAELYLKNSTGSTIEVADLGIVIANEESIPIDENDFDGYLSTDMIAALNDNPSSGLILSTTDHPDASGNLSKEVAIERLTMKSHWKPPRELFSQLPSTGNEEGDLRLVKAEGVIYRWDQAAVAWIKTTDTFSLEVTDGDEDPIATDVKKLVFVQDEDRIYWDSTNDIVYVGPPNPPLPLTNQTLILTGTTRVTGALSASNINYKTGDEAGDTVNYVTNDATFTTVSPSISNSCDHGDKGLLSIYLNGVAIAVADLAANFSESLRTGNQNMNNYDVQGSGDPIANGIVNFKGDATGKGYLQILSVGMYNNFKFYQKFTAQATITDNTLLRQGWNEIYMEHSGITPVQQSSKLDFFYDIDTRDSGPNPVATTPVLTEVVPSYQYLSGVKFYGNGSTWEFDTTGSNCFNNVYHSTGAPLVYSGWPGMTASTIHYTDTSVTGVSSPPVISESMSVSNKQFTQAPNAMSQDARLTVTPRDPYGNYSSVTSASDKILVWSYGNTSTNLIEHFRDEIYRLPAGSYNTIPGAITNLWNSQQSLVTYDDTKGLQVYMDELYFPTLNFSTYRPTGNPDYSGLASGINRNYYRAFIHTGVSHANGTLRITGITASQLYNRDVKVWIKAPTQTGWLDLTRDFNFATFTAIDEDGCWVDRSSQTNSDFKFSIGDRYTENSGWMIIIKIEYPSSLSPKISHLEITNW